MRSYIKESDEIGQDSIHIRELFYGAVEKLALQTDNALLTSGLGLNELIYHTQQSLIDLLIIRKDKVRLAERLESYKAIMHSSIEKEADPLTKVKMEI